MSGARTVREVNQARAGINAPPSSTSLALTVEVGRGQGIDVRFIAPRQRRTDLERAAAASLEETSARLPPALRARLAVEAGEVRSLLCREGDEAPLFSRTYSMASCRGVVLGICAGAAAIFESPWTGTLTAGEIDASLPVVLGPSAVLTLIAFALEVTGGHVAARSGAGIPGITVIDTASSPYPPQHHPFTGDGTFSPDRTLIEEGRWRNREEHAGDAVDPLFYLLTRPERALCPLAASTQFNRRNLAVEWSRRVPLPVPALHVDSWRALGAARGGAVPFHAELSYAGPEGERLAVPETLALHFDPWEVLARVEGAAAPAAPAVDEDPIEGNAYGRAPVLVTGLALAELSRD